MRIIAFIRDYYRLLWALIAFFTGVVLAGLSIYHEAYWAAFTLVLTGLAAARLALIPIEDWFGVGSGYIGLVLIIFGGITITSESRFFSKSAADTHFALFQVFQSQLGDPQSPIPSELAISGLAECAEGQMLRDGQDVATQFMKNEHFGPHLSLADSALSANDTPSQDHCVALYKKARESDPAVFKAVEEEFPSLLKEGYPS